MLLGVEMTRSLINDPDHWRSRAEEARTIAADLQDPETQRLMLEIAEGYDRLAERAEQRLKLTKPS